MTILIAFHQSHYRDFKAYYRQHVCRYQSAEFPSLVSYPHFVALIPLCAYLCCLFGQCTGISFTDSPLRPFAITRASIRTRSSTVWLSTARVRWLILRFLAFNDRSEVMDFMLTPGHVHGIKALLHLAKRLFGKLFADKGYLSAAMFKTLFESYSMQLVTKLRRNMKNQLMPLAGKQQLRQRAVAAMIVDPLKSISQIEHTCLRRSLNFLVNMVRGLIAYCHQPIKPLRTQGQAFTWLANGYHTQSRFQESSKNAVT